MAKTARSSPSGVEFKLLRLFDVLYATRSVTRAAHVLGQSQPTVSIWLSKLRRQLRDPLFVRTPSGMQPTPAADMLISQAREILESVRRLSVWEPGFVAATAQRRFRICMTDAAHIALLPELLAHVRAVGPQVRLAAARIDGNTAHALESGDADLALGYIPWLESGIYQQTLFPQDWICLANASHPRIRNKLSLSLYKEEAHISVVAGTGHQLLEGILAQRKIKRRVLLELPSFLGLVRIVARTDLIVTLPRDIGSTLAKLGGLRVFPCPIPIPMFTVKQHWHARYHNDPGNRWLREAIATLFLQHTVRGA